MGWKSFILRKKWHFRVPGIFGLCDINVLIIATQALKERNVLDRHWLTPEEIMSLNPASRIGPLGCREVA